MLQKKHLLSYLLLLVFCACGDSFTPTNPESKNSSSVTETAVASSYKDNYDIEIGRQNWMTKNLDVDKFLNGDPILEARTKEEWIKAAESKQPAWCYYYNDLGNGKKYGKLYNWYAVIDSRNIAPQGWHIPNKDEWAELIDFLGGASVAGGKMKHNKGWEGYDNTGNGTNESGFSALPGGYRIQTCIFDGIDYGGKWWSSTDEGIGSAWSFGLGYGTSRVNKNLDWKQCGLSVRCIKD